MIVRLSAPSSSQAHSRRNELSAVKRGPLSPCAGTDMPIEQKETGQKCTGSARCKNCALVKVYKTPKVPLLPLCAPHLLIVFGASSTSLAAQNPCMGSRFRSSVHTHWKNLLLPPAEASIDCFAFAYRAL